MRTLAIVGVGLIGGSIALAARAVAAADRILGVDADLDALEIARKRCSLMIALRTSRTPPGRRRRRSSARPWIALSSRS